MLAKVNKKISILNRKVHPRGEVSLLNDPCVKIYVEQLHHPFLLSPLKKHLLTWLLFEEIFTQQNSGLKLI